MNLKKIVNNREKISVKVKIEMREISYIIVVIVNKFLKDKF